MLFELVKIPSLTLFNSNYSESTHDSGLSFSLTSLTGATEFRMDIKILLNPVHGSSTSDA